MRFILDFRKYDGVVGGVEQGVLQLARYGARLGCEVLLVVKERRAEEAARIVGVDSGVEIIPVPVTTHAISAANARLDSGFFQDLARSRQAQLIHFFYNWSFPLRRAVPCLLTVHDVIPFTFREAMGWWRNRFLYRPAIRLACRLNDHITTVSRFSKQDICRKTGVPAAKITVVPNGLRTPHPFRAELWDSLRGRLGLDQGFILNSGGIHERKNTIRLLEAFSRLVREAAYPGKLVITGAVSGAPYQRRMKQRCDRAVERLGLEGRVVFAGFVSEEELDHLMARADLFVYPSLYEGFGIPVLEAMQAGTPVVASNATAIPEVAEDAALLVDPTDVNALAGAMRRILENITLRQDLIRKGRLRAAGFSWEKTCSLYFEVYRRLIGSSAAA